MRASTIGALRRTVAWLVIAGAVGCGAGAPTPLKARPASMATPSASTVATPEPEPPIADTQDPVASPPPPAFDPEAAAEVARRSAVLRAMPERCDRARFAMRAGDTLGTDLRSPVEVISTGVLRMSFAGPAPPAPKPAGPNPVGVASERGLAALDMLARGLDVFGVGLSTSEIAVCANDDERGDVVAMSLDMTGWGKPADVLARAFESKTRKAPARRSKDGVTFLQADPQNGWVAVVGSELIVVASSVELASAAVKRAQAPADAARVDARFEAAGGQSLWLETNQGMTFAVRRDGERHHAEILTAPAEPSAARDVATELEKERDRAGSLAVKAPLLGPLVPALRRATVTVADGRVRATTTFGAEWPQFVRSAREEHWKQLLGAAF